jgi:hypothetical protein
VLATARPEFIKVAGTLSRGPGRTVDGNVAAVAALVTFATATGAVVIAEGLETVEDIELMTDLGVTAGQGFALGYPSALHTAANRATTVIGVKNTASTNGVSTSTNGAGTRPNGAHGAAHMAGTGDIATIAPSHD